MKQDIKNESENISNSISSNLINDFSVSGKCTNGINYTFIVPVTKNRSDINFYSENSEFNQASITTNFLTNINVQLFDIDDNILSLNGSEWYMIINVK